MCECGCFMNGRKVRIPAPGGWYVLTIQPPCRYCGVGIGIGIDAPSSGTLHGDDVLGIEEVSFISGSAGLMVLGERELFDELRKSFGGMASKSDPEIDVDDDVAWDVLVDENDRVIETAMRATEVLATLSATTPEGK